MNTFDEECAIDAAKSQICPLGNAAAILGYHADQVKANKPLARELKTAAVAATNANKALNRLLTRQTVHQALNPTDAKH